MKIFVVVSAYNEEKHIVSLLNSLKKVSLPVIVVDDGSEDKTYSLAREAKVGEVIKHKVNLGKGAAMKTGAEAAFKLGAKAVIFMDADGQHKPSDLDKFVSKLNEGYEVVLGTRNYEMGVPLVRFLGNKFASVLVSTLFGIYVSDLLCGFRGVTRKAFEKMSLESMDYAVETEMVIKIKRKKIKYCEVSVKTIYKDTIKGVTILDAINIFFEVIRWRLAK